VTLNTGNQGTRLGLDDDLAIAIVGRHVCVAETLSTGYVFRCISLAGNLNNTCNFVVTATGPLRLVRALDGMGVYFVYNDNATNPGFSYLVCNPSTGFSNNSARIDLPHNFDDLSFAPISNTTYDAYCFSAAARVGMRWAYCVPSSTGPQSIFVDDFASDTTDVLIFPDRSHVCISFNGYNASVTSGYRCTYVDNSPSTWASASLAQGPTGPVRFFLSEDGDFISYFSEIQATVEIRDTTDFVPLLPPQFSSFSLGTPTSIKGVVISSPNGVRSPLFSTTPFSFSDFRFRFACLGQGWGL